MSLEDFQLSDNEPFDNSIIERDFTKIYHRQGDQINQSDQNIDIIFGENNNYHQIGNAYLEFNITIRKNDDTNFHYDDAVRSVNNGFAFCFKEARLSTTIGSDIETNNFCLQGHFIGVIRTAFYVSIEKFWESSLLRLMYFQLFRIFSGKK